MLRYRLRFLLVVTTFLGLCFAWIAHHRVQMERQQRTALSLRRQGALVNFDYQAMAGGGFATTRTSTTPKWVRLVLGEHAFTKVLEVHVGQDQPIVNDGDLKEFVNLPFLARLRLEYQPVTDDGLQHLSGMHHLREIMLDNTQVSDRGLRHLAKLRGLEQVWLRNTGVSQKGCRELQRALPTTTIIADGYHSAAQVTSKGH